MRSAPVLVTGATGLVGSNLVHELLSMGVTVRALVRPNADPRPLAGLDVEARVGDLTDPPSLERAVRGVGVIFHAAALVGIGTRGLPRFRAANVEGTRTLARLAGAAGSRLVHVSTVDTIRPGTRYAPSDDDSAPADVDEIPYVVTKTEAERVVMDAVGEGLDAVIVNPGFVLGPRDWKPSSGRLLLAVAAGRARIAPPGGNDFCHVSAVARAIVAAANRGMRGRRYILGGDPLDYLDLFRLIADVTDGPGPWGVAPGWLVRTAARVRVLAGRGTPEPDLNPGLAAMAVRPHHYSSLRAVEELGYAPRPAAEAVRDAWAWLTENGYADRGRNG